MPRKNANRNANAIVPLSIAQPLQQAYQERKSHLKHMAGYIGGILVSSTALEGISHNASAVQKTVGAALTTWSTVGAGAAVAGTGTGALVEAYKARKADTEYHKVMLEGINRGFSFAKLAQTARERLKPRTRSDAVRNHKDDLVSEEAAHTSLRRAVFSDLLFGITGATILFTLQSTQKAAGAIADYLAAAGVALIAVPLAYTAYAYYKVKKAEAQVENVRRNDYDLHREAVDQKAQDDKEDDRKHEDSSDRLLFWLPGISFIALVASFAAEQVGAFIGDTVVQSVAASIADLSVYALIGTFTLLGIATALRSFSKSRSEPTFGPTESDKPSTLSAPGSQPSSINAKKGRTTN